MNKENVLIIITLAFLLAILAFTFFENSDPRSDTSFVIDSSDTLFVGENYNLNFVNKNYIKIPNKPIKIILKDSYNQTRMYHINSTRIGVVAFPMNVEPGNYTITVIFEGDTYYKSSNVSQEIIVINKFYKSQ